jgi:hypothetical protein
MQKMHDFQYSLLLPLWSSRFWEAAKMNKNLYIAFFVKDKNL